MQTHRDVVDQILDGAHARPVQRHRAQPRRDPFPFGAAGQPGDVDGQRGARIRAADQGITAAQSRFRATGNALAADAGAAFIQLLVAQEKRDLQMRNMTELDRLRRIVAGRRAR